MNEWIYLSIIATFITAIGIILIKYIDNSKYDYNLCLCFTFIIMGIISIIYLIYNKNKVKSLLKICNIDFYILILFFAIILIINNIIIKAAFQYTPNIGYSHLIINLNIIITLIASYFLFNQKINWKTFIGIIISLIGICIVAFYSNND